MGQLSMLTESLNNMVFEMNMLFSHNVIPPLRICLETKVISEPYSIAHYD